MKAAAPSQGSLVWLVSTITTAKRAGEWKSREATSEYRNLGEGLEIRDRNKDHKSFAKWIARGPTLCYFCLPESSCSVPKNITWLPTNSSVRSPKVRNFTSPFGITVTFQGQLHSLESSLTQWVAPSSSYWEHCYFKGKLQIFNQLKICMWDRYFKNPI